MAGGGDAKVYEFGPFRLDGVVRRLTRDGAALPLTVRLFDILLLLVERGGEVVTKEEFMEKIWPDQFVEENNLAVSVSSLRRALGEAPGGREYIETVPKRGYRLIARVRAVTDEGRGRAAAARAEAAAAVDKSERPVTSLAVLPFVNLDKDESLEYFVDGITESIINTLARLPQLKVLARSTVFRYKGKEIEPGEVGEALGVDTVLVGSVRQVRELLIFGVELVSVEDRSQLWGERYERQPSDIFAVQEEIIREISGSLRLKLTADVRQHLAKKYTADLEAYHLYLKGRYFWNKRTEEAIRKGIRYFKRAIKLDHGYAPAFAGLADCYRSLVVSNVLPAKKGFPVARRAARRALEIDGMLAEAHASLAVLEFYSLKWQSAERELQTAVALNPNDAMTHFTYSIYLTTRGRIDEALSEAKQAQRLDPLSPLITTHVGRTLWYGRRVDLAAEPCYQALELDPNFPGAHGILGLVYLEQGACEEALGEFQKLTSLSDDPEAKAMLGYAYAVSGRRHKALRVLYELQQLSEQRYVTPLLPALIYAGLKEKEQTLKYLEIMWEERSYALVWLNINPALDYLRTDPRFINLLQRVGLAS